MCLLVACFSVIVDEPISELKKTLHFTLPLSITVLGLLLGWVKQTLVTLFLICAVQYLMRLEMFHQVFMSEEYTDKTLTNNPKCSSFQSI